ncbi:MAG: outer membrane protein assembly factor BamE [Desulfobacteraceae bacterium]|nr:MAG: outer membrane protein assembly factor BamE [Desulfobacteraceae bacterium]
MLLNFILSLCTALFLALPLSADAQELRYRQEPIPLDQMGRYADIRFSEENFDKIENGMTEEQVLSVLGRPKDLKKEQRRRGRWTVHYHYPQGHVVNFRNGMVVGKAKE